MKLLIGNKGNIDFDGQIEATQEQIDKLIDFLKFEMDYLIEVETVNEFRDNRIGDKHFQSKWTRNELYHLLMVEDISVTSRKLGRSWLSVDMKKSIYYRDFRNFVLKNKLNINGKKNIMKAINLFEEQNDNFKQQRKEEKREKKELDDLKSNIENRIDSIEIDIEILNSGRDKAKTKTLIEFKAIKTNYNPEKDDIDKYVDNYIKKQIYLKEKELKKLKTELRELKQE
ncbi:MAG: hypothetical protein KC550_02525 [Nanoarchaeota archaeon]|nr:hypothetical protein [Nanoarchaeota archaeon]